MTKQEQLKELYLKNNLEQEDVFILEKGGKKIPIITRTGVQKIQSNNSISIQYDLIYHSPDLKTAVIKAKGHMGNSVIETFGEVSEKNNKNDYPIAMAEKRALSRCVLTLSGFYQLGVFGEDEADDFKSK